MGIVMNLNTIIAQSVVVFKLIIFPGDLENTTKDYYSYSKPV